MTGDPHLPRKQNVALQHARACETRLRTNDIVFTDGAGVSDLHQTVDLGPALHSRLADSSPIDGRQRLNLDVIFDNGNAGLNDFGVRFVGALGETEAVPTDDYPVL